MAFTSEGAGGAAIVSGISTTNGDLSVSGNITVTGTVDGIDVSGIEAGATADQTAVEIIGLLNSDLGGNVQIGDQVSDTLTIGGPLTVSGSLVTLNTVGTIGNHPTYATDLNIYAPGGDIYLGANPSGFLMNWVWMKKGVILGLANTGDADLLIKSNNGNNAGDEWKVRAERTSQNFCIGNDIASAGTYVDLLTITPHATASLSKSTFAGYIVEGRTVIKVPATAFVGNDDTVGVTHLVGAIQDDGSNFGMQSTSAQLEFYAYIDIPLGYTATKVKVTGSATANEVEVYTLDLDDGTISGEISNGGLTVSDDTVLSFTDATCDFNNDPTITHDANALITVGTAVSGTGIPEGAYVASINSSTSFELSASTTGGAAANATLTFGNNHVGADDKMLLIKVDTGLDDIIYGGYVTIQAT